MVSGTNQKFYLFRMKSKLQYVFLVYTRSWNFVPTVEKKTKRQKDKKTKKKNKKTKKEKLENLIKFITENGPKTKTTFSRL